MGRPAGRPVKTVAATFPEQAAEPEALGRSRGGFSAKLHLVADRRSRPISRTLTAGQRHDRIGYPTVMAAIRIPHRRGRPRTRPGRILGDKAYSIKAIRINLRHRRIAVTIPERIDQQANRRKRGTAGGRPPAFDAERYKERNTVERAVGTLKQFRAVATRYDKVRHEVACDE
jgi:transposase